MQAAYYIIRPHLHGPGYHRQSSPPRVTLDELTIRLFLLEISAKRLRENFSGTRDN